MSYKLVMWADTKNPKCFPDFGCRTVGWQQKNQNCLSDFGCRSVGGQQRNQPLKEGVICHGRRTFLLNLSIYQNLYPTNQFRYQYITHLTADHYNRLLLVAVSCHLAPMSLYNTYRKKSNCVIISLSYQSIFLIHIQAFCI
jgi:hypothetical protein